MPGHTHQCISAPDLVWEILVSFFLRNADATCIGFCSPFLATGVLVNVHVLFTICFQCRELLKVSTFSRGQKVLRTIPVLTNDLNLSELNPSHLLKERSRCFLRECILRELYLFFTPIMWCPFDNYQCFAEILGYWSWSSYDWSWP